VTLQRKTLSEIGIVTASENLSVAKSRSNSGSIKHHGSSIVNSNIVAISMARGI